MKVKTRSPGWTPMPWHRVLVRRGDKSTDTPRDEHVGGEGTASTLPAEASRDATWIAGVQRPGRGAGNVLGPGRPSCLGATPRA